jgi:hypothetical protein
MLLRRTYKVCLKSNATERMASMLPCRYTARLVVYVTSSNLELGVDCNLEGLNAVNVCHKK